MNDRPDAPAPPIDEDMRAAAASHRGGHLSIFAPPTEAGPGSLRGWFDVDDQGELATWHPASEAAPAPNVEPADPIEQAIADLGAGSGDEVDVVDAVRRSMVVAVVGAHEGIALVSDALGNDSCVLFSSADRAPVGAPTRRMSGAQVLALLPRPITLIINGDGPIGIRIRVDD